MSKSIYLDHASATPIEPEVLKISDKIGKRYFANPSAIHEPGLEVKKIIEECRKDISSVFGAHSNELVFTSGATESNNLAILGILGTIPQPHIVTTSIEHASILELCSYLEKTKRVEVTYVGVEPNGIVDPQKIKKAIQPNTVVVSVMYANNEIGTIQPIKEIAKEIRHYKKNRADSMQFPFFHTDATQAINYLDLNVEKLGVDLLSFNASKIYGPKGIGGLFKKRSVSLSSVFYGGEQEFSLRPGTENVVGICALSAALKITDSIKGKETKRLIKLRDHFVKKLLAIKEFRIVLNGDSTERLPNNVNITVPKIPSDLLVIELSARGVMASAKSACKSGDGKSSHVIMAINKEANELDGSIRFSLGRVTTKTELDDTVKILTQILKKLKPWYGKV